MVTAKAKIVTQDNYKTVVPLAIPSIEDVKSFAAILHSNAKPWKGDVFGWQAEYNPERSEPPLDSNMKFTPADFCIGESGIWFYSLMWEQGGDKEPVEFLDEAGIVPQAIGIV